MRNANFPTIEEAILYLSRRCDHARTLDGMGYNGGHAPIGHDMAAKIESSYEFLPFGSYAYAGKRMLPVYAHQLEHGGISMKAIRDEAEKAEQMKAAKAETRTRGEETWHEITGNFIACSPKQAKLIYLYQTGRAEWFPPKHIRPSAKDEHTFEISPWIKEQKNL